jgi:GTP cyclohydrolase IA
MNEPAFNTKKMEKAISLLLEGMGCDARSENFRDTPRRVAALYRELLTPKQNNFQSFTSRHNNLILLRGHRVTALCPHHLLPVTLRVSVGYIPNGRVLGLSKLARTVESQLTQPILQEALTDAVVDTLEDRIQPQGVGCVVAGSHGCMHFRGIRTTADIITSRMSGVFLLNATARQEFLQLLGEP